MSSDENKQRPLREWREHNQLTQFELAVKSNVGLTTIRDIEADRRTPNVVIAMRLADALGVAVADIYWPKPGELAKGPKSQATNIEIEDEG